MDEDRIVIVDDDGHEVEYEVLFTFENDENGKKYVLYFDDTLEEPQVYSSIYDDDGHLYPVDSLEDWDMIEEVFNAFVSEEE